MMMKYILYTLVLLGTGTLFAQENVNIYTDQVGKAIRVLVDNDEVIPVSIVLDLDLKGMESSLERNHGTIVVPPKTKAFIAAEATIKPNARKMSFGMETSIWAGDITLKHDKDAVYTLPIASGKSVEIYQGYNGRFSHRGEKALDFSLEIGDEVYAARSGIVSKVVEEHNRSCSKPSCAKYNNIINIYHDDGTFAEYIHLQKDGALVSVGDTVKVGELIGISGNTGWSSGPHLHFMVYHFRNGDRVSLGTRFSTSKKKSIFLKEKEYYQR